MSRILFNNASGDPSTPASGKLLIYAKTDKRHYVVDENGVVSAVVGEQFIYQQGGAFTLTSTTIAQKMFGSPASAALTVPSSTSYQFECEFDLASMSSGSGGFGFAIGGTASFTYSEWCSIASKAALATAVAPQVTMNKNSVANAAIVTNTTVTIGWGYIRGLLRINVGGTIIPEVSLSIAAAATVGQDSWFRAWPTGSNVIVSAGNWA